MGVRINNSVDYTACPACTLEVHRLVIALDNSLDQHGNLIPPGVNMTDVFDALLIAPSKISQYDFDLRLCCRATCEVDKPSTDWVITNWNCRNANQGAHMATPMNAVLTNENVGELPPVHPGILKDWLQAGGPDRKSSVVGYADVPAERLENIINEKA